MANITKLRLSGTTYTIVDETAVHSLAGYATTAEVNSAITAATDALAQSIAEQGYQTSGDVQSAISGKADTTAVTAVNNALTGHTANTDIHVTVADKTAWNAKLDAADVAGLFGNVAYDSQTKHINFYHESTGGTVLAYVDATDFVKDGFLQSVTIENKTISGESVPCLVFVWNTDSGIQETDIPLSGIFDASNYYTKDETDAAISAYTYDKQTIDDKITQSGTFDPTQYYNKTDIDGQMSGKTDVSAFTAHTADTTVHVTSGEKSTWNAKADISDIPTSNSGLTNDKQYVYLSLDSETLVFNT